MALGDRRSELITAGSALGCARGRHPRLGLAVQSGDPNVFGLCALLSQANDYFSLVSAKFCACVFFRVFLVFLCYWGWWCFCAFGGCFLFFAR